MTGGGNFEFLTNTHQTTTSTTTSETTSEATATRK